MAKAFKCDLCGGLYEGYDGVSYFEPGRGEFKYNTLCLKNDARTKCFDACPECMQAMIDFLRSRPAAAYTKKGEN